MRGTEAVDDARRAMEVCNACRYCEGFCAVFPAMELRRSFENADLSYLANLCHGCRGCYYACQYAPPHEFGINLPKTFAELRMESYEEYGWPRPLAGVFRRNGLVVSLAAAFGLVAVFILTMLLQDSASLHAAHTGPGAFYAVIPWGVMAGVAGVTFCFSLLALAMGFANFWRDAGTRTGDLTAPRALAKAVGDALTLRYLGGGGHGCNDRDEAFSMTRRWLHHAMFYGFMLCFAATCVATIYDHFLIWPAPYPFFSLPVLLGTVGGIGMVIGCFGLFWLKLTGDQGPMARKLLGGEVALLALLAFAALSGLLLLTLRATPAMGVLLALHLGFILALFLVLPYSRFVHGVYRFAALIRNALERDGAAAQGGD